MDTKFNSQVCTSKVQSERLLALGLKKETADMMYEGKLEGELPIHNLHPTEIERFGYPENAIPAWSLHRLLCLYGQDYEIKELYNSAEECYGMLITAIGRAIENEEFNEEYLNNGVYTH